MTMRTLVVAGVSAIAGLALGWSASMGVAMTQMAQSGHSGGHSGSQMMDHSAHGMTAEPSGDTGPSSRAFAAANAEMHAAMDIAFTGNADVDFVRGMIPHHQGAVAMAGIVLEYGTDPRIRALAEAIIAAQESEIAFMTDWLEKTAK